MTTPKIASGPPVAIPGRGASPQTALQIKAPNGRPEKPKRLALNSSQPSYRGGSSQWSQRNTPQASYRTGSQASFRSVSQASQRSVQAKYIGHVMAAHTPPTIIASSVLSGPDGLLALGGSRSRRRSRKQPGGIERVSDASTPHHTASQSVVLASAIPIPPRQDRNGGAVGSEDSGAVAKVGGSSGSGSAAPAGAAGGVDDDHSRYDVGDDINYRTSYGVRDSEPGWTSDTRSIWTDEQSQLHLQQWPTTNRSIFMYSPHPGSHALLPYRPLSVVPQRPRSMPASTDPRALAMLVGMPGQYAYRTQPQRISWADGAKLRARLEHEEARREEEAISHFLSVRMDVMPAPEQLRRRQSAAAAAAAQRRAAAAAKAAAEAAALEAAPAVEETPVIATTAFVAQEDIELSFDKGEELHALVVTAPAGWMMARNIAGKQGLVPETYIKLKEEPAAAPAPAPAPTPATPALKRTQTPVKKAGTPVGIS